MQEMKLMLQSKYFLNYISQLIFLLSMQENLLKINLISVKQLFRFWLFETY